jgi:hypothetical protein
MTRGASLASHGFRAIGAERNCKQQSVCEAQQVECITSVPNLLSNESVPRGRKLTGVGRMLHRL